VYEACSAAMALGASRSVAALPELVRTVRDVERVRYVRACAASAIGRILDPGDVPVIAELLAPHDHLARPAALEFARDMLDRR